MFVCTKTVLNQKKSKSDLYLEQFTVGPASGFVMTLLHQNIVRGIWTINSVLMCFVGESKKSILNHKLVLVSRPNEVSFLQ